MVSREDEWRVLRLFSHDGKVRILNRDSRCASWITIRNTVFWTVCTPNHVEIRDLRCASQITVQRCFRVTHLKSRISTWFGVHTVQNTVFRIVIPDAHLESRLKIRTLPSCENSLNEDREDDVCVVQTLTKVTIIASFNCSKVVTFDNAKPKVIGVYTYAFLRNQSRIMSSLFSGDISPMICSSDKNLWW